MTQRSGSGGHKREGENEEEQLPLDTDVAIPVNPALAADVLAGLVDETGEPLDEPQREDTVGEAEPGS